MFRKFSYYSFPFPNIEGPEKENALNVGLGGGCSTGSFLTGPEIWIFPKTSEDVLFLSYEGALSCEKLGKGKD